MIGLFRAFAATAFGLTVSMVLSAPLPSAAQEKPPGLPIGITQVLDQAGCVSDKLSAAIAAAIAAQPGSAVEIATYAVQRCPADADRIAAAAAKADPTDAAAILVAVILALPPDQQTDAMAGIVAAVEQAVPGATSQITASIVQLAANFNQNGPDVPGRPGGWPLVSPQTDVPSSPR